MRRQLLVTAFYESYEADNVLLRPGTMRPNEFGSTDNRIITPRPSTRSWKGSAKHRLVRICPLATLRDLLVSVKPVRVYFGEWLCIVSEASSQLTIRPKINDLKNYQGRQVGQGEEGMRIIVILYSDLHRYFLIYESLRYAARTCVIPPDGDDCCQKYRKRVSEGEYHR